MSKAKEWMSKVTSGYVIAVDKYTDVTNEVERKIMNVCGSDKMMDDVTDSAASRVIAKAKDRTMPLINKAVDKTAPVRATVVEVAKSISSRLLSVFSCVPALPKKKEQLSVLVVPMCRPIPHIPCGDALLSGVPVSVAHKRPAPMTLRGEMEAYAAAGVAGVPVCVPVVCK